VELEHFAAEPDFWRDIYTGSNGNVYSRIQQYRRSLVLAWIDELRLPAGSIALELGCGAGLTAVALAQRGLRVQALDATSAMVELAREQAAAAGVADRVEVNVGDAHELPFDAASVNLVVAMGLIPWLHDPRAALSEIARVLRPRGTVVVTCDNAHRLDHLLDPLWSKLLAPVRDAVGPLLPDSWRPRPAPVAAYHSVRQFDKLVVEAGLHPVKGQTFGFGPFTFLARSLLPERLGVRLHDRLQGAADRGAWLLSRTGAQYAVAARRGAS
jgi:ubiquinone/menaquinone biosynthesis C-methylase UbiE